MSNPVLTITAPLPGPLSEQKAIPTPATPKRRSRFFFIPFDNELTDLKQQVKPRQISLVDEQLNIAEKEIKVQLPKALDLNASIIRDFILNELSPKTLAVETGMQQAITLLARSGIEVDESLPSLFLRMAKEGSSIRLAEFLTKYLELPAEAAQKLLPQNKPQAPQKPPGSDLADQFEGLRRALEKMNKSYEKQRITPTEG